MPFMKSKKIKENFKLLESSGSYDPKLEHDACGWFSCQNYW